MSWWTRWRDFRVLRVGTRDGKPRYLIGTFSPAELVMLGVVAAAIGALALL